MASPAGGLAESMFDPEVIKEMRQQFDEADKDGNGTLDATEACFFIARNYLVKGGETDAEIQRLAQSLFKQADTDRSGTITFDEYCRRFGMRYQQELNRRKRAAVANRSAPAPAAADHAADDVAAATRSLEPPCGSETDSSCFAGLGMRLTSCCSSGGGEATNPNRHAAAWRAQANLAKKTYKQFADERAKAKAKAEAAGLDEVVVDDKHFEDLRSGDWFIMTNALNKARLDFAIMQDGTGTQVHPKAHLRTVDFVLRSGACLEIVNEEVYFGSNKELVNPKDEALDGRTFARVRLTVPRRSFPAFGSSYFLVSDPSGDGHRLAPTVPIDFKEYWTKKSNGYEKYGPTFVQFLESFELSKGEKDRAKIMLDFGKSMTAPISNKNCKKSGGEKVVVRGFHKLGNLQRHKIVFPRQSTGTMLNDSVDGYIEKISLSWSKMQLTLLVPHDDDVTDTSHPFGPEHDDPETFHHHHNSYSKLFHVQPLTGKELIAVAGSGRRVSLPKGTVMEHTFVGLEEVAAAAAIQAGVDVGADAAGAAVAAGAAGGAAAAKGAAAAAVFSPEI